MFVTLVSLAIEWATPLDLGASVTNLRHIHMAAVARLLSVRPYLMIQQPLLA